MRHDYGRVIHPNIYYKAHDILITEDASTKRDTILEKIYNEHIYDNVNINSILSRYLIDDGNETKVHENWLNVLYNRLVDSNENEATTNGIISGKCNIKLTNANTLNAYTALLSADKINLDNMTSLVRRISEFGSD